MHHYYNHSFMHHAYNHAAAVPNLCLTTNGGCSHFCLLSAVDPRHYHCDCPKGMTLGDDSRSCIDTATTLLTSHGMKFNDPHYVRMSITRITFHAGSCVANGYSSCCVNGSCQGSSSNCYCDANCHLFKDCCRDVPSDCKEKGIAQ